MPAIEIRGLVKHYGTVEAVRGIDLTVEIGEVFALLGPNGAGKTTTVEVLEGFLTPTDGQVRVLGVDPGSGGREFRDRIGIVLQSSGVNKELTVRETLRFFAPMYTRSLPVDDVIDLVGLGEKADARVKTLSGGQQRRLDLALGIIGDPDLIFLDEPTTGFDPSARRRSWSLVDDLKALGKTILLTTHYMDEAQYLADRVAVIAAGRIVAEGTPETLGGRADAATIIEFSVPPGTTGLPVAFQPGPDGRVRVEAADPVALLNELTGWALASGTPLHGLAVTRSSLEDVYLSLTGDGDG
ncbi:MAG: ABC transporter ATP-binding protein [Acidimicrobiia bacterium]